MLNVKEHTMDKSQAISSLSAEIKRGDTDLYYFQPKGQKEKFFIGAAVISAAATVLLTAFFDGLESSLKGQVKDWGEALGAWIGDHLSGLFKKAPPPAGDELDSKIASVKSLAAGASAAKRAQVADEVEKIIHDTLQKHGVSQARAATIAASTRQSAMALAST
jgi:hypothetical protein